jgi:uncharacterized protein
MSWNLVGLAHVAPQPWRNGGGVTRELLALPDEHDWTVRISVADVKRDGPFSSFPGVQRCFAVLSGDGVRLRVDEVDHDLTPQDPPLRFDGADPVSCVLLGGATEDLNLMVRGRAARMQRVGGSDAAVCAAGALVAVFANKHAAVIRGAEGQQDLQPRTLAWRILESNQRLALIGEDALWMEIEP